MVKKLNDEDFAKFKNWVKDNAKKTAEELTPIYKACDNRFGWIDRNKTDKEITEQIKDSILNLMKNFENGNTYIASGGIRIGIRYGEPGDWQGYIRFEYDRCVYSSDQK